MTLNDSAAPLDKSALTPLDLVLNLCLSLLPMLITVSLHFRCRQKKEEELKILREENPALKEENARLRKTVDTQKEKKKPNESDSAATMIGTKALISSRVTRLSHSDRFRFESGWPLGLPESCVQGGPTGINTGN